MEQDFAHGVCTVFWKNSKSDNKNDQKRMRPWHNASSKVSRNISYIFIFPSKMPACRTRGRARARARNDPSFASMRNYGIFVMRSYSRYEFNTHALHARGQHVELEIQITRLFRILRVLSSTGIDHFVGAFSNGPHNKIIVGEIITIIYRSRNLCGSPNSFIDHNAIANYPAVIRLFNRDWHEEKWKRERIGG